MALQGVNLPLAFTGQEYVQRALFKEFGMSDEEVHSYFTGPAFLAWFLWVTFRPGLVPSAMPGSMLSMTCSF